VPAGALADDLAAADPLGGFSLAGTFAGALAAGIGTLFKGDPPGIHEAHFSSVASSISNLDVTSPISPALLFMRLFLIVLVFRWREGVESFLPGAFSQSSCCVGPVALPGSGLPSTPIPLRGRYVICTPESCGNSI
jgi:hypothetical protein